VLIDGGKGQLSAVAQVLSAVPLAALAKREERLFSINHPAGVLLDTANPGARILLALRDYAHRFALRYHTLLRKKGHKI
jgi:excinuclease ABC subunit C